MRVRAQTTCIADYSIRGATIRFVRISKGDTRGIRLNLQGNKQEY